MTAFRYIAIGPDNRRFEGVLEAADEADAIRRAQSDGRVLVRVHSGERRSFVALLNQEIGRPARIRPRELEMLLRTWASLLIAGITLPDALALSVAGQRQPIATTIQEVAKAVREGATLAAALTERRGVSPAAIAIVRAGESAGNLGPTLQRFADTLAERQDFAERLRSALLYPAFLLVAASIAIAVLLVVVVPNIESLVTGQNMASLPVTTQFVIAASTLVRAHALPALIAVLVAIFALAASLRVPVLRRGLDHAVLWLPVAGQIVRTGTLATYCGSLSSLLAGGVRLSAALSIVSQTIANGTLRGRLTGVHAAVVGGRTLADALSAGCRVPPEIIVLIRTGERTGRLAEMLASAASLLSRRVRGRLEAIATLAGPVLTVLIGLVAGLIVYAMFSAILSMNEAAFQ